MKIAYLILAYNQPEQLFRLYNSLNQDNSHFYIHIDKKTTNLAVFTDLFSASKNVTIFSEHKVYWFGFNMVAAMLSLLRKAFTSADKYKYFVLMSGQDYPIKSKAYINDFLEKNNCDFIDYHKISHLDPAEYLYKFQHFHHYDNPYTNPRHPGKVPLLVKLYYYFVSFQRKFVPKRKFYNNMVPYFGSQWFTFTYDTVKMILDFVDNNKGYVSYMKTIEGPDEIFFQTIIGNSERKTNLAGYEDFLKWEKTRKPGDIIIHELACLQYMDWSITGKPRPAVMDMEYFQILKDSPFLFARKFDQVVSKDVMEKLDREVLRLNSK